MYPSHMGRARLTVIDMWPVGVKIKGAILNRFMDAMNEKILTMIKVDPGRTVKDKIDINSSLIALINWENRKIIWFLCTQKEEGKISRAENKANQFNLKLKILTGSKIENKFPII